jgi:acylphosphatase
MKRVRCLVSGRVQGVFFRGATQARMRELGVAGWVRNLPDGRVEAVLEGDDAQLEAALAFLRRGPRGAMVEDVELHDAPGERAPAEFEVLR